MLHFSLNWMKLNQNKNLNCKIMETQMKEKLGNFLMILSYKSLMMNQNNKSLKRIIKANKIH